MGWHHLESSWNKFSPWPLCWSRYYHTKKLIGFSSPKKCSRSVSRFAERMIIFKFECLWAYFFLTSSSFSWFHRDHELLLLECIKELRIIKYLEAFQMRWLPRNWEMGHPSGECTLRAIISAKMTRCRDGWRLANTESGARSQNFWYQTGSKMSDVRPRQKD